VALGPKEVRVWQVCDFEYCVLYIGILGDYQICNCTLKMPRKQTDGGVSQLLAIAGLDSQSKPPNMSAWSTQMSRNQTDGGMSQLFATQMSRNKTDGGTAAIKSLLTPFCITITWSITVHPQMHMPFGLTYCCITRFHINSFSFQFETWGTLCSGKLLLVKGWLAS